MAKSVFHDLFPAEEAAELEMRAKLLSGINKWLSKSGLTQIEAAKRLGITQARVSEIKNGKINRFSLSMLVRLAERAGLRPGIRFQKAASARSRKSCEGCPAETPVRARRALRTESGLRSRISPDRLAGKSAS